MRNDFCIFILTNRRAHKIITLQSLQKAGYTGKVYIVIDDEDPTREEYIKRYKDNLLIFSKQHVSTFIDDYDNSGDKRTILWARNACWSLASQVGCRYFMQLDDDYTDFLYRKVGLRMGDHVRKEHGYQIKSFDSVIESMIKFLASTPTTTIALSQGGDHFGGQAKRLAKIKRKAMNSFLCDTERPFLWRGRFNEDVNTYVGLGSTGHLFFTYMQLQLNQVASQSSSGGITELYKENGTYVKSFYTVITSPSSVRIQSMGRSNRRLHHNIDWKKTVPMILDQKWKK
jgi:hypothetical protein